MQIISVWAYVQELYKTGHKYEIVSFNDAYDTLWAQPVSTLIHEFKLRERLLGKSFFFGSECACFPPKHEYVKDRGRIWCSKLYPKAPRDTKYRYLNSGLWIGRVWAAQRLLSKVVMRIIDVTPGIHHGVTNDQLVIAEMFVQREFTNIVNLDYDAHMLQNMNRWHQFTNDSQYCNPTKTLILDDASRTWYHSDFQNNDTVVKPALFHFPGEAKESFYAFEATLPWLNKNPTQSEIDQENQAMFSVDSVSDHKNQTQWQTFYNLCGDASQYVTKNTLRVQFVGGIDF